MQLTAKFCASDKLDDLYQRQVEEVRRRPKEASHRISLFQLFCVRGEWDRALAQLAVLRDLSGENEAFVRTYDTLIRCERFRQLVFAGERQPLLIGEPEPWVAYLMQALAMDVQGAADRAAELRTLAFDAAPATEFALGDQDRVEWLADADSRFGPMFEACLNGKYYWIPLHRINRIAVEAPTDLRDLVWVPASITFASGGEEVAFLPARYPGSELASDDALKLARRTDWLPLGGDHYRGLGQHMWTAGDRDFALLDVRSIARLGA